MSSLPPTPRIDGKRRSRSCSLFLSPFINFPFAARERLWLEQQLMRELGRLPHKVDDWSEYELMQRISGAQEEEVISGAQEEQEDPELEEEMEHFGPSLPSLPSVSSFSPLPVLSLSSASQMLPLPSLSASLGSAPSAPASPHKWTRSDISALEAAISKHGRSWTKISRDPAFVFSGPIEALSEKLKVNKIKSYGAAFLKAREMIDENLN